MFLGTGLAASAVLLSAAVSFAATGPTYSAGQVVDVYTYTGYGTSGLTITLFSQSGEGAEDTVPLTSVGDIQATGEAGTPGTFHEYSFTMPNLGTQGPYGALINVGSGVVFTRFVGYGEYPNAMAYGTTFTFDTVPGVGQMPEVPYAAGLPLVAGSLAAVLWRRRARAMPTR